MAGPYHGSRSETGSSYKHHTSTSKPSKEGRYAAKKTARLSLRIEPRSDWYNTEVPALTAPPPTKHNVVPPTLIEGLHKHGQKLLEEEDSAYAAAQLQTSSSYKFMSTIMGTGTYSDKVSALTLVVQESPIHTVKPLENLIGLAGKKSREQALMALAALKDLMDQGNVLPDRKLRLFTKQPALLIALQGADASLSPEGSMPNGLTSRHLMMWAYEDHLKRLYLEMLKILERWCHDELEFARLRALDFAWELLKDKPEQEENLLRFLVNKLGDTAKKVASKASFRLCGLQETHPAMTMDIVNSIEADILLRPGQSSHAKYYAVITLNQFVLRPGNPEVADRLLDVYFTMFRAILNRSEKLLERDVKTEKKVVAGAQNRKRTKTVAKPQIGKSEAELDEKVTAQVLTGIHRAFPYSKKDSAAFEKHFDTMFRITHSSNFNTSLQALILIQQISTTLQTSTDRYMRTLYQSLFDPRLFTSSKQPMYMNLLYRSLKDDPSTRRVTAFVKRLLQTLSFHDPPFICLALYLVIELSNTFPSLRSMLDTPEISEEPTGAAEDPNAATDAPRTSPDATSTTTTSRSTAYDGRKREPEYSNAHRTCLWDILPYMTHHHPSVSLFATHLLTQISSATTKQTTTPLPPKPDPATHTLTHFLDKFAYKNPKSNSTPSSSTAEDAPSKTGVNGKPLRGTSLMQPALASSNATDSLLPTGKRATASEGPVNTEAFWSRKLADVRVDEVFFHNYFGMANAHKKGANTKKEDRKKRRGEDDEEVEDMGADIDGEGGEIDEDEVFRAIVGSKGAGRGSGLVDDGEEDLDDDDEDVDAEFEAEMMGEDSEDEDVDMEDEGDESGSDDGSIVAGEEDADLGGGVALGGAGGEEPEEGSLEALLAGTIPASKSVATTKSKAKKAQAPAEEAEEEEDDDPFALGSDEGSSSEDDSDADTGKSTKKANQRKQMSSKELQEFIAAESAALASGKTQDDLRKERKQKRDDEEAGAEQAPRKKRRMKALPMFGDADDWARLIDGDGGVGLDG